MSSNSLPTDTFVHDITLEFDVTQEDPQPIQPIIALRNMLERLLRGEMTGGRIE